MAGFRCEIGSAASHDNTRLPPRNASGVRIVDYLRRHRAGVVDHALRKKRLRERHKAEETTLQKPDVIEGSRTAAISASAQPGGGTRHKEAGSRKQEGGRR